MDYNIKNFDENMYYNNSTKKMYEDVIKSVDLKVSNIFKYLVLIELILYLILN